MATSPVSSTPVSVFLGAISSSAWLPTHKAFPKINPRPAAAEPAPDPAIESKQRDAMLLEHLPIVRFVARKIHERLPQHIELDDLIGAGIVGLIDAFNKFDRRKEVQFRSYAQFRIRGAILDSLRSLDWGSRDLRRKSREIEDATQRLTHRLNRRPAESEVAEEIAVPLARYQQLLGNLKSLEVGSLNELHSEDSPEEELAYVATAPEEDPLYRCLKNELSAQLTAAMADLPEREAHVLTLYYGEEMTLKQIGAVLGLAESRISQIRAAAVLGLRARMRGAAKQSDRQPAGRAKYSPQSVPALVSRNASASSQSALPQQMAV